MIDDRLPNVIFSRPFSNGSFSGFAKQTVNTTKTIESRELDAELLKSTGMVIRKVWERWSLYLR
jgi:hypothetical protein